MDHDRQDAVEEAKELGRALTPDEMVQKMEYDRQKAMFRDERKESEAELMEEPDLPHMMEDEDTDLDKWAGFGVLHEKRAGNPGWIWDIRVSTPIASNENKWTEYRVVEVNLTLALEELAYAIDFPVANEVISVRRGKWWNPMNKVERLPKFSENEEGVR